MADQAFKIRTVAIEFETFELYYHSFYCAQRGLYEEVDLNMA